MWLRVDRLPESFGVQTPLAGERAQLLNYLTDYTLVVSGGALPQAGVAKTSPRFVAYAPP